MKIWVHFLIISSGILIIVIGFILKTQFPAIMSKQLDAKLIIRADSPTLANFITPPIPIYMQFYFFNVTNPSEILEGAKPKLHEVGPYTYLENRLKHDLNWTDSTVEYLEKTNFVFQPDLSGSQTEDDLITTLNPVLITLAAKLSNPAVPQAMHGLFEVYKYRFGLTVFISKKAGELLFKGYREDMLLELGKLTNNSVHKTGRFGFFYPKNDTDRGTYLINTGAEGLDSLQLIEAWKGSPTLDYWSDKYCNMINGTTGGQFPQPIIPERNISMFSADLCRSLYLSYEKKTFSGKLELLRYTLPHEVLANRAENQCYCSDSFTCKASLVNLAPCRGGAPVIASTPHFYMGDAEVISAVDGLHPVKEYHETYVDVEPNTGVSFEAVKRIQISMPLKRYADLPELSKVKEVILPLLWLNESAKVPVERANALHLKLTRPVLIVTYVCYTLYVIGGLVLIIPIVVIIKSKHDAKKAMEHVKAQSQMETNRPETYPLHNSTNLNPSTKSVELKNRTTNSEEHQPLRNN